ncbi:MAG: hypothetical protein IPK82_09130 [Polyangiaceae bacterium]|nr:hypothetical protein [Polyangiaceae bacterium]
MKRQILWACAALVFAAGCGDSKSGVDPASTAKATASASAVKPPATAVPSSKPTAEKGMMARCPTAVDGATTDIQDVEGGVVVTVTAKDESKVKDIRERAKFQADASKNEAAGGKHDGSGGGGGAFGRCPVVNRNTSIEVADVDGGSKITVKAKDAAQVDWLRRESRERLQEMGQPGAKEAGQGKMAHCPSSVDGAVTAVKAAKDAVIVTVTAKDEAKTKEIRERGKFLVEASKKDPNDVVHKGDGSGGGGFGRCPVVLKDTTVESKEVEGGAEFTVKPKKPEDLAKLEKEANERAEKLAGRVPSK